MFVLTKLVFKVQSVWARAVGVGPEVTAAAAAAAAESSKRRLERPLHVNRRCSAHNHDTSSQHRERRDDQASDELDYEGS